MEYEEELTTFELFPKFPFEIQLHIRRLAVTSDDTAHLHHVFPNKCNRGLGHCHEPGSGDGSKDDYDPGWCAIAMIFTNHDFYHALRSIFYGENKFRYIYEQPYQLRLQGISFHRWVPNHMKGLFKSIIVNVAYLGVEVDKIRTRLSILPNLRTITLEIRTRKFKWDEDGGIWNHRRPNWSSRETNRIKQDITRLSQGLPSLRHLFVQPEENYGLKDTRSRDYQIPEGPGYIPAEIIDFVHEQNSMMEQRLIKQETKRAAARYAAFSQSMSNAQDLGHEPKLKQTNGPRRTTKAVPRLVYKSLEEHLGSPVEH